MRFVFLFLTSLCITGSRFIHLTRTDSDFFLLMVEWYFIVHMYHNFFTCSSVHGYLGCFHVLAVVNTAAMNIGVPMSSRIVVFSGYMPSSKIAGSYGSFIFFFLFKEISILFSIVAVSICIPTNSAIWFPFSTSSPAFIICIFIDDDHSDQCDVIPHCRFDLHISNNKWCWAFFHVFISHLYVFFGKMSA